MFEAWRLQSEIVAQQEEQLRRELRQLPDTTRNAFYKRYNGQLKDPDTYATLNWFFIAGLHNFYLKQWAAGAFDLTLMIIGLALLPVSTSLGISMIILVSVIELPALFRSQIIVRHYNTQLGWRLLQSVTHPTAS